MQRQCNQLSHGTYFAFKQSQMLCFHQTRHIEHFGHINKYCQNDSYVKLSLK